MSGIRDQAYRGFKVFWAFLQLTGRGGGVDDFWGDNAGWIDVERTECPGEGGGCYMNASARGCTIAFAIVLSGVVAFCGESMQEDDNPIPARFAEFVDYVESNELSGFFRSSLDFHIDTSNTSRGYGMPPEFYPVVFTGVDGVMWGFLLLAPELEHGDIPLIQFSPMDSERYSIEGKNIEESLLNILALEYQIFLELEEDEAKKREARSILTRLYKELFRIELTDDYVNRAGSNRKDYRLTDVLNVPPDYAYIDTSDGLGILVPRKYVNGDLKSMEINVDDFESIRSEVKRWKDNRLYGNALFVIQEYRIKTSFNENYNENNQELKKDLVEIYEKLDRSILIENVNNQN